MSAIVRLTHGVALLAGQGIDSIGRPLHNPDLLFGQPVKLVDLGVYLTVSGLG